MDAADCEAQLNSLIEEVRGLERKIAGLETENYHCRVGYNSVMRLFEMSMENAEKVADGLTKALKFEVYAHEAWAVLEEFRRRAGLPTMERGNG